MGIPFESKTYIHFNDMIQPVMSKRCRIKSTTGAQTTGPSVKILQSPLDQLGVMLRDKPQLIVLLCAIGISDAHFHPVDQDGFRTSELHALYYVAHDNFPRLDILGCLFDGDVDPAKPRVPGIDGTQVTKRSSFQEYSPQKRHSSRSRSCMQDKCTKPREQQSRRMLSLASGGSRQTRQIDIVAFGSIGLDSPFYPVAGDLRVTSHDKRDTSREKMPN